MIAPMTRITFVAFALLMAAWQATVHAQDVPGIEICTVEKTMERRTSCLQSNVDFLQKTINKLYHGPSAEVRCRQPADRSAEGRGRRFAEGRERSPEVQNKAAEDAKKAATPAAKDAAPAAKDAAPAKDGAK